MGNSGSSGNLGNASVVGSSLVFFMAIEWRPRAEFVRNIVEYLSRGIAARDMLRGMSQQVDGAPKKQVDICVLQRMGRSQDREQSGGLDDDPTMSGNPVVDSRSFKGLAGEGSLDELVENFDATVGNPLEAPALASKLRR